MGKSSGGQLKSKDIDRLVQKQADVNRIGQNTPFGTLDYSGGTANLTFSSQQQALLEQQQLAQLMAGQTAQTQLGGLGAGRGAVEQAMFDRTLALLRPEFGRREGALRQRLANQGLPQTSRAFTSEFGRFEEGVNRQLEQAALASVLAGGQEESRVAQMALALLGAGGPAGIPLVQTAPIDIPYQPGGGLSAAQSVLGGAATGASIGAAGGGWGVGIGAGLGGLLGLFAR